MSNTLTADPSDPLEQEIALWGPSTSGKTWLVYSLGKALMHLADPLFEYKLWQVDTQGKPVRANLTIADKKPNQKHQDEIWLFQRLPHEELVGSGRFLSTHTHRIKLHDLKGDDTRELKEAVTTASLLNSPKILLMLDPTITVPNQSKSLGSVAEEGKITQDKYCADVRRLFDHWVTADELPGRSVALCFTKIDQLNVQKRDPWQLIAAYFGQCMIDLLKDYEGAWAMKAFCVSAVGYLSNGKANYDIATRSLDNLEEWRPYNVTSPFFWLFQESEKQRLQRAGNAAAQYFFNEQRSRKHASYPIEPS